MSKNAIFWGHPTGSYHLKTPVVVEEQEDYPVLEIINDFIKGFDGKGGKYLLGLPDPFFVLSSENAEQLVLEDVYKDKIPKTIIPTLMYFVQAYNSVDKKFILEDIEVFCSIVKSCCGYDVATKKVNMRVDSSAARALSSLGKNQISKFIRCKLRIYILNNYLKIGGLSEYVSSQVGSFIIDANDCNILIKKEEATLSCYDNIKHPKIDIGGDTTKQVGYNIDHGLALGLEQLAKEDNSSVSKIFINALRSDRWGKVVTSL